MAKQTINNGETGSVIRGKINDNFTELYTNSFDKTTDNAGDIPILDVAGNFTATTVEEALAENFSSVVSGKNTLEATITTKGGTVSKVGSVATFSELDSGIDGIPTGVAEISTSTPKIVTYINNNPVQLTYYTLLDITGKGVITAIRTAGIGSSRDASIKVTLDGIAYTLSCDQAVQCSGDGGGNLGDTTSYYGNRALSFSIPLGFETSAKVEINSDTTTRMEGIAEYILTSNDIPSRYLVSPYLNGNTIYNPITSTYYTVLDISGSSGKVKKIKIYGTTDYFAEFAYIKITVDNGTPEVLNIGSAFAFGGLGLSGTLVLKHRFVNFDFNDELKFSNSIKIEVMRTDGTTNMEYAIEYSLD